MPLLFRLILSANLVTTINLTAITIIKLFKVVKKDKCYPGALSCVGESYHLLRQPVRARIEYMAAVNFCNFTDTSTLIGFSRLLLEVESDSIDGVPGDLDRHGYLTEAARKTKNEDYAMILDNIAPHQNYLLNRMSEKTVSAKERDSCVQLLMNFVRALLSSAAVSPDCFSAEASDAAHRTGIDTPAVTDSGTGSRATSGVFVPISAMSTASAAHCSLSANKAVFILRLVCASSAPTSLHSDASELLHSVLSGQGQHLEALRAAKQYMGSAPTLYLGHYLMGLSLLQLERYKEAVSSLQVAIMLNTEKAIRAQEVLVRSKFLLAMAHVDLGEYVTAVPLLRGVVASVESRVFSTGEDIFLRLLHGGRADLDVGVWGIERSAYCALGGALSHTKDYISTYVALLKCVAFFPTQMRSDDVQGTEVTVGETVRASANQLVMFSKKWVQLSQVQLSLGFTDEAKVSMAMADRDSAIAKKAADFEKAATAAAEPGGGGLASTSSIGDVSETAGEREREREKESRLDSYRDVNRAVPTAISSALDTQGEGVRGVGGVGGGGSGSVRAVESTVVDRIADLGSRFRDEVKDVAASNTSLDSEEETYQGSVQLDSLSQQETQDNSALNFQSDVLMSEEVTKGETAISEVKTVTTEKTVMTGEAVISQVETKATEVKSEMPAALAVEALIRMFGSAVVGAKDDLEGPSGAASVSLNGPIDVTGLESNASHVAEIVGSESKRESESEGESASSTGAELLPDGQASDTQVITEAAESRGTESRGTEADAPVDGSHTDTDAGTDAPSTSLSDILPAAARNITTKSENSTENDAASTHSDRTSETQIETQLEVEVEVEREVETKVGIAAAAQDNSTAAALLFGTDSASELELELELESPALTKAAVVSIASTNTSEKLTLEWSAAPHNGTGTGTGTAAVSVLDAVGSNRTHAVNGLNSTPLHSTEIEIKVEVGSNGSSSGDTVTAGSAHVMSTAGGGGRVEGEEKEVSKDGEEEKEKRSIQAEMTLPQNASQSQSTPPPPPPAPHSPSLPTPFIHCVSLDLPSPPPPPSPANIRLASQYMTMASAYIGRGAYELAMKQLSKAEKKAETHPAIYFMRASVYEAMGQVILQLNCNCHFRCAMLHCTPLPHCIASHLMHSDRRK